MRQHLVGSALEEEKEEVQVKQSDLSSDCQEKYDNLIDYINKLPLDSDDKQCLIDRVDDLVDWIRTSD